MKSYFMILVCGMWRHAPDHGWMEQQSVYQIVLTNYNKNPGAWELLRLGTAEGEQFNSSVPRLGWANQAIRLTLKPGYNYIIQ